MDPRAGLPGDPRKPLGGAERRRLVAPDRMGRGIVLAAMVLALDQPRLVLGMDRDAPPRPRQDRGEPLVVGDQQVAGGRAHEDLDPGGAGQPLQFGDVVDIAVRAADEEGEVAVHAAGGARAPCRQAPLR